MWNFSAIQSELVEPLLVDSPHIMQNKLSILRTNSPIDEMQQYIYEFCNANYVMLHPKDLPVGQGSPSSLSPLPSRHPPRSNLCCRNPAQPSNQSSVRDRRINKRNAVKGRLHEIKRGRGCVTCTVQVQYCTHTVPALSINTVQA